MSRRNASRRRRELARAAKKRERKRREAESSGHAGSSNATALLAAVATGLGGRIITARGQVEVVGWSCDEQGRENNL